MEASDRIGQLAVRSTRNERGRLSPLWPTTQLKEITLMRDRLQFLQPATRNNTTDN